MIDSSPYDYDYQQDKYYCYPDASVLHNKLGITEHDALNAAEREIADIKMLELEKKPLPGELNFDYLSSIDVPLLHC